MIAEMTGQHEDGWNPITWTGKAKSCAESQ